MVRVKDVAGCVNCPLRDLWPENTFVPPKLGPSLRLVIAEAPGSQEQIEGLPLVGGAGKVAKQLYNKAGINLDDCTKLNVIQCRPKDNIFPDATEAKSYISKQDAATAIKQCLHNHVKPVLESRPWERVDVLGAVPLKYLTGLEGGINRWRGSITEIDTDKL